MLFKEYHIGNNWTRVMVLPIRNRFEYWRLQLSVILNREVTKKEFAELLGVNYGQYKKWSNHVGPEPGRENIWTAWQRLKFGIQNRNIPGYFPEINMQDMVEETPQ